MSFARNMAKKIRKNLSSEYSQKLLDHTKQFATDALKTASRRTIQKTAEATRYLRSRENPCEDHNPTSIV